MTNRANETNRANKAEENREIIIKWRGPHGHAIYKFLQVKNLKVKKIVL